MLAVKLMEKLLLATGLAPLARRLNPDLADYEFVGYMTEEEHRKHLEEMEKGDWEVDPGARKMLLFFFYCDFCDLFAIASENEKALIRTGPQGECITPVGTEFHGIEQAIQQELKNGKKVWFRYRKRGSSFEDPDWKLVEVMPYCDEIEFLTQYGSIGIYE